jgi:hypothetical protein
MTNVIRLEGMIEEVASATSLAELKEIWCINQAADECPPEMTAPYKEAVAKWRGVEPAPQPPVVVGRGTESVEDLRKRLEELEAQVTGLRVTPDLVKPAFVPRSGRRYRLLSTDVSWSTADQVHDMMSIIAAHVAVGDVFEEDDVVAALDANPHILQTAQGARKIFAYYKGKHERGLEAHGNIERA